MSFSSLGLSSALLKAIDNKKYVKPNPVQKEAIPAILSGRDVMGIAQTGSGKTASYVLPILEQMQQQPVRIKNRHVKVLVLVPTRELAVQIYEAFDTLGGFLLPRIKCMAIYGGVSINPQMMQLQGTEILVATPGRLLELVSVNAVSLATVQTLVLDEADKMLNMGFKEEMTRVLALLPTKRQTLLFSATLTSDLEDIHKSLLHNPVIIKVEEETENLDLIEQTAYLISEEKKGPLLRYIIRQNNRQQVLVFASSVHRADSIVVKLNANGIDALAIHSKKSQGARTTALHQFKTGSLRVLVATDLMSRGIDIKLLPCVINYELPRSPKDYIHRIGRTGRAGAKGEAISLISPEEEAHFKVIQKKMGKVATLVNGNAINLQGY
jgi:ATP-dependent RNA helicase RhlE